MIGYDCVGIEISSKNITKFKQTIFNPFSAVIKVDTGIRIITTKKGSADTAGSAMVKARTGFIDDVFAGNGLENSDYYFNQFH